MIGQPPAGSLVDMARSVLPGRQIGLLIFLFFLFLLDTGLLDSLCLIVDRLVKAGIIHLVAKRRRAVCEDATCYRETGQLRTVEKMHPQMQ